MNEKGVLRLKEGEHPWGSREDSLCKLLGQIAAGPFPSGILGFKCFKIPRLVGGGVGVPGSWARGDPPRSMCSA